MFESRGVNGVAGASPAAFRDTIRMHGDSFDSRSDVFNAASFGDARGGFGLA